MPPDNNQPIQSYGPAPVATPITQPFTDNSKHHAPKGIIATVILVVLLIGTLIFGIWAFMGMQDYKNNSDEKSAAAVVVAEADQEKKLQAEFAEQEKLPVKTYQGSADFGSVKIVYPKTWSAYIDENTQGTTPIDAYFNTNFVPGLNQSKPYSLRMQVVSQAYTKTIKDYDNDVKKGALKATPFIADQVKGTTGLRLDGQITNKYRGSIVLIPLRDKTLKIWTETEAGIPDFNNIVLKNLTFVP